MALILAVVWSSLVVRPAVSAFLASLCIVENRHQFRRTWLCDEHLIQSHQDESSLPLMFYISFMFHEIWEIILYTQANTILILILMQNDYQKLLQYKKALIFLSANDRHPISIQFLALTWVWVVKGEAVDTLLGGHWGVPEPAKTFPACPGSAKRASSWLYERPHMGDAPVGYQNYVSLLLLWTRHS